MPKPAWADDDVPIPDLSRFVIEDDEPVDNVFSEKEQRLLTHTLYTSWRAPREQGRTFAALANVGLFFDENEPPYCPDVMIALDTHFPHAREKKYLSYFVWVQRKMPDVAIEIVSNKNRHEEEKIDGYARIGIPYYVIHDPERLLGQRELRVYENHDGRYVDVLDPSRLPRLPGLGLVLWTGVYEDCPGTWLRWCDADGRLLPTGTESAETARAEARAAQTRTASAQAEAQAAQAEAQAAQAEAQAAQAEAQAAQAEAERARWAAEEERARAERLAARLRALGLDPEAG